ncbi:DUF1992 domain-containing protein [Salaquimonas pukyongi]|uniref:DnaJ family domain-containing protein n=1 Tax=Salaquimonas pukyongi TaxID=2712698 RepID=UPI00096B7621|nr:DUF1992 domain-containing protein [Salaquimonas pukyongi]
MNFHRIADQLIENAMERGVFENLPGQGNPLPPAPLGDPIEAFGFQLMAKTGAIPAEVQLKKEILRQTEHLRTMPSGRLKLEAMQTLANLQMRLAMMLEGRR